MEEKKAVILLSGGMDSTVLLYYMLSENWQCHALSIHYGQRHSRELAAARAIANKVRVPHIECDLGQIRGLLRGSSQTDAVPVPEGHYEDPVMRLTVVPNRNMILLSVAAATAIGIGAKVVAYAAHTGDHAVYPDCRPEFIKALGTALRLCHYDDGVRLMSPFVNKSKADIARIGAGLAVPFELTYSCYQGQAKHCGKCGTCVERREAFQLSGISDPTEYNSIV